jgi:hypothetical protein
MLTNAETIAIENFVLGIPNNNLLDEEHFSRLEETFLYYQINGTEA